MGIAELYFEKSYGSRYRKFEEVIKIAILSSGKWMRIECAEDVYLIKTESIIEVHFQDISPEDGEHEQALIDIW